LNSKKNLAQRPSSETTERIFNNGGVLIFISGKTSTQVGGSATATRSLRLIRPGGQPRATRTGRRSIKIFLNVKWSFAPPKGVVWIASSDSQRQPASGAAVRRRDATPRAKREDVMSRILGLVLALALTAGGALWLVFILALAEHVSNRLIAAARIVFAMGVYWLWIDYIHARPGQDE
jgi:hypothetical protein